MSIESGDTVVFEYVGRVVTEDGGENVIFHTSDESLAEETGLAGVQPDEDYGPMTAEVGSGELIEGLDEELVGRETGDSFTVTVSHEKAYGDWTEDEVREYDVDELEEMIGGYTPQEGATIRTKEERPVEIIEVDDGVARVDFNHPLAGKTLEFEVEIVEVR